MHNSSVTGDQPRFILHSLPLIFLKTNTDIASFFSYLPFCLCTSFACLQARSTLPPLFSLAERQDPNIRQRQSRRDLAAVEVQRELEHVLAALGAPLEAQVLEHKGPGALLGVVGGPLDGRRAAQDLGLGAAEGAAVDAGHAGAHVGHVGRRGLARGRAEEELGGHGEVVAREGVPDARVDALEGHGSAAAAAAAGEGVVLVGEADCACS